MKKREVLLILISVLIITLTSLGSSYIGPPSFNEDDWPICFDGRNYPINYGLNIKCEAWEILIGECPRKPDNTFISGGNGFYVTDPRIYLQHETSCPAGAGGFWNTREGAKRTIYGTGNACCPVNTFMTDEDDDGSEDDSIIQSLPYLQQEQLCCSVGDLSKIYDIPQDIEPRNAACCPINIQYAQATPSVLTDTDTIDNIAYDKTTQGCCIQENDKNIFKFFGIYDLSTERCCSNPNGWDSDKWLVAQKFKERLPGHIDPEGDDKSGEDCCLNEDEYQKGDTGVSVCDVKGVGKNPWNNKQRCCKIYNKGDKINGEWTCKIKDECDSCLYNKDTGCGNDEGSCCACGVYSEFHSNLEESTQTMCRCLAYNAIKKRTSLFKDDKNNLGSMCDVLAETGQYEGTSSPSGRICECCDNKIKYPDQYAKAVQLCNNPDSCEKYSQCDYLVSHGYNITPKCMNGYEKKEYAQCGTGTKENPGFDCYICL